VAEQKQHRLALCPLHLTLYRQCDATHVVFLRPTVVGSDSKAAALLPALESDVADTIGQGLATGRGQGSAD